MLKRDRLTVAPWLLACLIVTLLVLPSTLYAGSFRILDQSASAVGQASAFTAQADDPSRDWSVQKPSGWVLRTRPCSTSHGPWAAPSAFCD